LKIDSHMFVFLENLSSTILKLFKILTRVKGNLNRPIPMLEVFLNVCRLLMKGNLFRPIPMLWVLSVGC